MQSALDPTSLLVASTLSNLLNASTGSVSVSTTPLLSIASIADPPIPGATLITGWNAGDTPVDHSIDKGDGDAAPDATGVFGVLDIDHSWRVYQLSIDPDNGRTLVTPTTANRDQGTGPSSIPPGPGTPVSLDVPVAGGRRDQNLSSITNSDGSPPQVLPDLAHVSVFGVLDTNHFWRLYRLTLDANTSVIGLRLLHSPNDKPFPDHMTLFDAMGRTLADSFPDPRSRIASLDVTINPADRPSVVYVKVSADDGSFATTSDSAPLSDNFILQITRESATTPNTSLSPMSPSDTRGSATLNGGDLVPQSPTSSSTSPARSGSSPLLPGHAESQTSLGPIPIASAPLVKPGLSLSPVSTGPLPERAGAALGGVLDEGDPVPPLDRHNPAMIDLALAGLSPHSGGDVAGDEDELLEDLDDLVPEMIDPLVTIRGPGGFPLLASSLHDGTAPDYDAMVAALPSLAPTAMNAPESTVLPVPVPVPVPKVEVVPLSRTISSPSAVSSLTVALGMVFGLRLPDLTTLLTHLGAPRRKHRFRFGPLRRRRRGQGCNAAPEAVPDDRTGDP